VPAPRSFVLVRDDGPHNIVLGDPVGRLIDMHAYDDEATIVGPDGIERHGPNGLAYESGGFCGAGVIAGKAIQCMSAEFQVRSHTGYEHDADDAHDVLLLHERFGIALPQQYRGTPFGQSSPSIGSGRS
jgi:lincosamide nucleotidyltransferase A/C/D/E